MKKEHFSDLKFDDEFSKKVFKQYVDRLDYYKKFFVKSDIEEFKKFETQLDDQLLNGTSEFYTASSDRYKIRMDEAEKYMLEAFDKPFDFNGDESIQLDPKKMSWSKDAEELKRLVDASHFFDLPAAIGVPAKGMADYQFYTLAISDSDRQHSVRVLVPIEDPALLDLIQVVQKHVNAIRTKNRSEHP